MVVLRNAPIPLLLALLLPPLAQQATALQNVSRATPAEQPLTALEGKLVIVPGAAPILRTPKKDYPLSGKTPYLFRTLQDTRLLNREVRLEGREKPDGTFEAARLYTVRGGKLYRVRYFCEVCNIEALEPGDCVCCQLPTELQELPAESGK